MRSTRIVANILGGVTFGVALLEVGCWPFKVTCQDLLECCTDGTQNCVLDAGTSNVLSPECVPREHQDPVATTCGVFVSNGTGDDGTDGSQAMPVKTLA